MQATPLHSESRLVTSPNSTAAANLAHNNIPNPNYNGNDSFTFKTFDGHVGDNSNTTKALIVVNGLPDVGHALPSTATLWPPNHEMVSIMILNVTSPHGEPVKITITGIWQDEPTTGAVGSSGEKSPDGLGIGTSIAQVRSERDGTGDGRVYHIYFTADDGHGGISDGQVLVSVPHDQSGKPALDEGSLYDSTKQSS
jgi:hypothetical protein